MPCISAPRRLGLVLLLTVALAAALGAVKGRIHELLDVVLLALAINGLVSWLRSARRPATSVLQAS